MKILIVYIILAITQLISGAPMADASDSDGLVGSNKSDEPEICETEVLLNKTSCHPAYSNKVVYCVDETNSNCQCDEGTFCHYVGMAHCVFICLHDKRAGGPEVLDQLDFSEYSIKGPFIKIE